MEKKVRSITLKANWIIDSPMILKANAFRSVFTPTSTVLYIGLVDPELMLIEDQKPKESNKTGKNKNIVGIRTLARYCLDHDELIRLKKEIDKTVEGLKKMGALKDAK